MSNAIAVCGTGILRNVVFVYSLSRGLAEYLVLSIGTQMHRFDVLQTQAICGESWKDERPLAAFL